MAGRQVGRIWRVEADHSRPARAGRAERNGRTSAGFVNRNTTSDGTGIPGGVGGGAGYAGHVIFYIGVPNVEAALQEAERLGGTRRLGPVKNPGADLVVGHFTDPAGHLIGLAGPA
jgi:predicted enzyme related to lactoylglutathione lyase